MDDLTGVAWSASQGFVGQRDIRSRPLMREGELLETVPGLIMTQHSGDGKSNQMFVRGFSLDHGTDFSTRVEGMQVNTPTHAHGQGYTDLNFIIPELVDHVEYKLGPYHPEVGDFGAAGGAHLRLRRSLPGPLSSVTIGENGYQRFLAAGSRRAGAGELLAGGEVKRYDGPWAVPQELRKLSGTARYSWERGSSAFSVLALGYDSRWSASDQVPSRLVESGAVGRFSQVDSTLGGESSRASLSGTWMRAGGSGGQRLDLYAIRYSLDLYSNFTYYLEDPEAGDQINQRDAARTVLGVNFAHSQRLGSHELTLGFQTRFDDFDVSLRATERRRTVATIRADRGTVAAGGAWIDLQSTWSPRVRTSLALRGDFHRFDVTSDLPANSGQASDGLLSPKASVVLTPVTGTEVYLSAGTGFHSNDARGTVQRVDPRSGEPVDPVDGLVPSRGAEIGVRTSPVEGWQSTVAVWGVELDSELLFVGDAGTTEPSDGSGRAGVTWTNFARITPRLTADLDVALARARFRDVPAELSRIPGSVENVVAAGVTWEPVERGPFASLRLRRFGSYPLVEDDSKRAEPTSLLNLGAGWQLGRMRLGVNLLNALDARAADIQYFYGSRLRGEPQDGVEDVHFHPVEPRQLRVFASWGR
jgi:hypothetical protein